LGDFEGNCELAQLKRKVVNHLVVQLANGSGLKGFWVSGLSKPAQLNILKTQQILSLA
jgi:hypothetical protein